MKKRLSIVIVISLLTALLCTGAAGLFIDLSEDDWFYEGAAFARENGFVSGYEDGSFKAYRPISWGEAVKISVLLSAKVKGEDCDIEPSTPWYSSYINYGIETGIIGSEPENPYAFITRGDFALLIYNALKTGDEINTVEMGMIPDVSYLSTYAEPVYALYRWGIAVGGDSGGRFYPDSSISRGEAAAILMRGMDFEARLKVDFGSAPSAEEIYETCSKAVFSIETFDESGNTIRTGSGFFISGDGYAITNLHVLDDAVNALITCFDGTVHLVLGTADFSEENNTALLKIEGEGFSWLPVISSEMVKTGQTAYSLGNPLALDGTISRGIVSFVDRQVDGREYLQFTSHISQGSGGGALLDEFGRVIGITSSSFTAGQTLNLATPSKFILELRPGEVVSLEDINITK